MEGSCLNGFSENNEVDILKTIKNQRITPEVRIGQKMTYYSLKNCISCVYLFPVINYARKKRLVDSVEIIMARNKEEYTRITRPVIEKYFPGQETFSPLIILSNDGNGMSGMVKSEIIQECANNVVQHLSALGDDAMIDFLDGELEIGMFFQKLLLKMASNLEEKF